MIPLNVVTVIVHPSCWLKIVFIVLHIRAIKANKPCVMRVSVCCCHLNLFLYLPPLPKCSSKNYLSRFLTDTGRPLDKYCENEPQANMLLWFSQVYLHLSTKLNVYESFDCLRNIKIFRLVFLGHKKISLLTATFLILSDTIAV